MVDMDLTKSIKELARKAEHANSAVDAVHYSQAALNLTNALASAKNQGLHFDKNLPNP